MRFQKKETNHDSEFFKCSVLPNGREEGDARKAYTSADSTHRRGC